MGKRRGQEIKKGREGGREGEGEGPSLIKL